LHDALPILSGVSPSTTWVTPAPSLGSPTNCCKVLIPGSTVSAGSNACDELCLVSEPLHTTIIVTSLEVMLSCGSSEWATIAEENVKCTQGETVPTSSKTLVVGWYSGTTYWNTREPSVVSTNLRFVLENWPFWPTVLVSSLCGSSVPSSRLCLANSSSGPSRVRWMVSPILTSVSVVVNCN